MPKIRKARHSDKRRKHSCRLITSRVDRLFAAEINLRVSRQKFDSHAKPHARTIRSGRRTVARAVASWRNAMNFRTRFVTHERRDSLSSPIYQRVNAFAAVQPTYELNIEAGDAVIAATKSCDYQES